MTKTFLFSTVLLATATYSQDTTVNLEGNNVRATISNSGVIFNQDSVSRSGYESPKGDGNHLIYSAAFWFGAMDEFGNLKMAADLYGGDDSRDTYPGALTADGSAEAPAIPYADEIYVVSRDEILFHATNYAAWDYVAPYAITNWPAHGDVSEGLDFQLAPFADLNGNGIYEPEIGEYPEIRGDHAAYMIMNDRAGLHGQSGGDPLGIEIHYMFYQFDTDDAINNTTFINMRVINRSSQNYPEFIVGTYMDSDVGYGINNDDYVGCNPANNLMFGYNGDNMDEGGGGEPGYGENPPAVGFKLLNHTMNVSGYFDNSGSAYGTPITAIDFWNYMHAKWKNGASFTYGGNGGTTGSGVPTNYMYPSDPTNTDPDPSNWSELSADNPPGDRRVFMATDAMTLNAGDVLCFDYAVMTSSRLGNHLENASNLIAQAPLIQSFYDAQPNTYCDFTLGIEETENESFVYDVYPNPSTGTFNVYAAGEYTLSIYTIDGRNVYQSGAESENTTIQTNLTKGTYVLVLQQNGELHPVKINID